MLANAQRKWLKGLGEGFGRRGRVRPSKKVRPAHLRLEELEERAVPAGLSGWHQPQNSWLWPGTVRQAYGFNNLPAFSSNGQSVAADGRGQTIAIIGVYDDPQLVDSSNANFNTSDLAVFDQTFGDLDPPSFQKIGEYGPNSALPAVAPTPTPKGKAGEALETSFDVEWAHTIAPGANILLVEANSGSLGDIYRAAITAADYPGVSVVSISRSLDPTIPANANMAPALLSAPGVTFVGTSADNGRFEFPAAGPAALIVGGTQLSVNSNVNNNYQAETAWFNNNGSTGGGQYPDPSTGIPETPIPSWQASRWPGYTNRISPDVAYAAVNPAPADNNPAGDGFAVVDSWDFQANPKINNSGAWVGFSGTSAGAPQWAGLIAIANQGRALELPGRGPLNGIDPTLPLLYSLPASDFHQVPATGNLFDTYGTGSYVIGSLGSPRADRLIPDLVTPFRGYYSQVVNSPATSLLPGQLVVYGNNNGGTDHITLRTVGNDLVVTDNNQTDRFPVGSFSSITVNTRASYDTVDLESTPNVPLSVNLGAGSDTVNVSPTARNLAAVAGGATVNGGTGLDTLNVNDHGNGQNNNYFVTGTSVTRTYAPTFNYFGLNEVFINGGGGSEIYHLGTTLNGSVAPPPGAAANRFVTLNTTGSQTNRISVVDRFYADASNNIQYSLAGLNGLQVNGHTGDRLVVDNTGSPSMVGNTTVYPQTFTLTTDPSTDPGVRLDYATAAPSSPGHFSSPSVGFYAFTYFGLDTVELDGGASGETFRVGDGIHNLDALPKHVLIQGAGNDTVTVNDSPNATNAIITATTPTFTITGQSVTRSNAVHYVFGGKSGSATPTTEIDYGGVAKLEVDGGHSGNAFNVQGTAAGTPVTIQTGAGNDTVTVGDAANTVAGIRGGVTVHGRGTASLNVNDQGTTTAQEYDVWSDHITWAPYGASSLPTYVTYDGIANLIFNGSSGPNNALGVVGTAPGTTTVVNGHGGNDEFVVSGSDDTLNGIQGNLNLHARPGAVYSYVVVNDELNTSTHAYRLSSPGAGVNEIERFDMLGKRDMAPITYEGQDEEIFYTPERGGQVINLESNAGPGSNFSTGIFTDVTSAAGDTVNLGRPNPSGPGRLLDQIQFEVVVSSYTTTGSPTINIDDSGDSVGRQATLDTNNYAYNIAGLGLPTTTYYGQPFQSLIYLALYGGGTVNVLGGSGGNVFHVKSAPPFSLGIDGGSGVNTLDYSGYVGDVVVDLALGTATGLTAGIRNIRNVTGSIGNDLLIGDGNANVLRGGTGRNILIGGGGGDQLFGGQGDNLLIAGSTGYDASTQGLTGLEALMKEWTSSDPFSTRMQIIRQGLTVNGQTYALNSSTVFDDDTAADTLWASPDPNAVDWVFSQPGDTVNNPAGGQVVQTPI
jgi:hypothetical protein